VKMTKPTQADLHAAQRLSMLLDEISEGDLDHDDMDELQCMIGHIERLIMQAPGFWRRVIGGMCLVIMHEANKLVDPEADTFEFHPEIKQAKKDTERLRFLVRQLPGSVLRPIFGEMSWSGDLDDIRARLDDARIRSKEDQINTYGKVLSEP